MDEFTSGTIPKRKRAINWSMILVLFAVAGMFVSQIIVINFLDAFFTTETGSLIMEFSSIIFILLVIGTAIAIQYYEWRRWHNRWQTAASRMGLFYESYKPKNAFFGKWARISGTMQGFAVVVERFTRGAGKNKKIYTSIKLTANQDFAGSMKISKKDVFSGLSRVLRGDDGLQEFQLGDSEFDRKLTVRISLESFARNCLSIYGVTQKLLDIQRQAPNMTIVLKDRELFYSEKSQMQDEAYLAAVMRALVELAASAETY